jgi:uncharacterized protein (DUF302 family)
MLPVYLNVHLPGTWCQIIRKDCNELLSNYKDYKTYEEAINSVTSELKKEDFGILTEIDAKETLKKKLDADFRRCKILGTCNPPFAYQALQAEAKIGLMLPCNVIVTDFLFPVTSPTSRSSLIDL